MPAPQASQFGQLARQSFRAGAPGGAASRGGTARGGIDYEAFIDSISTAICSAWGAWQSTATMVGIIINGPAATGGQVVGPPLAPLIIARGPSQNPEATKMTSSIASAIGTGWLSFTATIKVGGMPWYPAFAAVPGPVAPPMPNVPCPIVALTMNSTPIGSSVLARQMANMDPSGSNDHKRLYAAIADAFEKIFNVWKVTTIVTNVLGTGPVPTFAPPYVPVGPVVGGLATMLPGGFI